MKQKKQNEISVLLGYAGKYKVLTFLGMFLSAVAMVMGMIPYVCIWLAARDLIKVAPNWTQATEIAGYGWLAFGFAFGGKSDPALLGRLVGRGAGRRRQRQGYRPARTDGQGHPLRTIRTER